MGTINSVGNSTLNKSEFSNISSFGAAGNDVSNNCFGPEEDEVWRMIGLELWS